MGTSLLDTLRQNLPERERTLVLAAIGVIAAATIGNVLFVTQILVPQWQARQEQVAALNAANQQFADAQKELQKSPEDLREEIEAAEAQLERATDAFFSETQAAGILNQLYTYADESSVEILDLSQRASPEGEEAASSPETPKGVYDAQTFRLRAEGSIVGLTTFVTRIQETAYHSFLVLDLDVSEGDPLSTLVVDFTLYTSPYSSGVAEPVSPGVTPTPVDLSPLIDSLQAAWAEEDWERAILVAEQILAVDPDQQAVMEKLYTAHVEYGYQLLGEGNNSQAAAQFTQALEVKPGGQEATAGLQQASATPTPTLSTVEQLESDLDQAWEAEEWEEAIRLIEAILAIEPARAGMSDKLYSAYVNYGYQLADEDKLDEAKQAFTAALTIKPDGAAATTGLQSLTVTPTPTPTPTPAYVIHVVQPGENLFRIALRYDTTVEAIMAANGLSSTAIYAGQQLRIPGIPQ